MTDLEKAEREVARWRILVTIHIGGPWPVNEGTIQMALEDSAHRMSLSKLRRELDYLARKDLVKIHDTDKPSWSITLTALGTDVVEYTAGRPDGIGRPSKW